MHDLLVALVSAVVGTGMPWAFRTARRLVRGDAERSDLREAGELERLTTRHGNLEELVDLLRRELDKALVRGSATLTMARILLFAVDQEPEPSAAMIAAREQAREVVAAADAQMKRGR